MPAATREVDSLPTSRRFEALTLKSAIADVVHFTEEIKMDFALIGAAGSVTPRHMKAMQDTGDALRHVARYAHLVPSGVSSSTWSVS